MYYHCYTCKTHKAKAMLKDSVISFEYNHDDHCNSTNINNVLKKLRNKAEKAKVSNNKDEPIDVEEPNDRNSPGKCEPEPSSLGNYYSNILDIYSDENMEVDTIPTGLTKAQLHGIIGKLKNTVEKSNRRIRALEMALERNAKNNQEQQDQMEDTIILENEEMESTMVVSDSNINENAKLSSNRKLPPTPLAELQKHTRNRRLNVVEKCVQEQFGLNLENFVEEYQKLKKINISKSTLTAEQSIAVVTKGNMAFTTYHLLRQLGIGK